MKGFLNMKKVVRICPTCKEIKEYMNESDAARKTKINQSSISKAIRGVRETAGGFVWKNI